MRAIDTNLIVRYLTGDHPLESAQARALIDDNQVFVSATVLLETEWVLRSVYQFPRPKFSAALRAFAGLPTVTLENAALAAAALDWLDGGMDFADALHLSKAGACEDFVTFDRKFARSAKKLGVAKVRTP